MEMVKKLMFLLFFIYTLTVTLGCRCQESLSVNEYLIRSEYFRTQNVDSALHYANTAIEILNGTALTENHLRAWHYLGIAHNLKGDFESAIASFKRLLSVSDSLKNHIYQAKSFLSLGNSQLVKGDYLEASKMFYLALTKLEEANDSLAIGSTVNSLAEISFRLGDYKKAVCQMKQVIKIWEKLGEVSRLGKAWNNLAIIYQGKNMIDSAKIAYSHALWIKIAERDTIAISNLLNNIGSLALQVEDYTQAISHYEKSKKMLSNRGRHDRELIVDLNLGISNFYMGNLSVAEEYFQKTMEKAERLKSKRTIASTYQMMSYLFAAKNNWALTNRYRKKYQELSDSINDSELKKLIVLTETKYEAEKVKKDLLIKEKENEVLTQKNIAAELSIIRIIFGVIIIILILVFFLVRSNFKVRLNVTKLEAKNRELVSMAVQMNGRNQSLRILENEIVTLSKEGSLDNDSLRKLTGKIKKLSTTDKDLRMHFEKVHPSFFNRLIDKYDLTQYEQKLCAYIRIKMDSDEIANLLNVSLKAIHQARYRVKKKLMLGEKDDLNRFIGSI